MGRREVEIGEVEVGDDRIGEVLVVGLRAIVFEGSCKEAMGWICVGICDGIGVI